MSPTPDGAPTAPAARAPREWRLWATAAGLAVVVTLLMHECVRVYYVLHLWSALPGWRAATDLATSLRTSPLHGLREVLATVRYQSPNLLTAFPVALLELLFGTTFTTHTVLVTILYAAPGLVCLLLLFQRLAQSTERVKPGTLVVAAAWLGLQPIVWAGVTRGGLEVAGLILIGLVQLRCLTEPPHRQATRSVVLVGLGLAALVLVSRWYAYWVAAFVLITAADAVLARRRRGAAGVPAAGPGLRRVGTMVGTAVLALLIVAAPMLWTSLWTELGAVEAGGRGLAGWWPRLLMNVGHLCNAVGWGHVALSVVAVGWGVLRPARRRVLLLLGLQLGVTMVLLSTRRVLEGHPERLYLFVAEMTLPALLLFHDARSDRRPLVRQVTAAALAVIVFLGCGQFLSVFRARPDTLLGPWARLTSRLHLRPLSRSDVPEVTRMLATLGELSGGRPGSVYVLSTGAVLSADSLRRARLALGRDLPVSRAITRPHEVDRRDGFPVRLLESELVVVCAPVQLDRSPGEQQVVALPARQLLERRGIGAAYERLSFEFRLDGGVKAHVFRRLRRVTPAELQSLSDELRAAHPNAPFVYAPPPADAAPRG